MMSLMVNKASEENKIKEEIIKFNRKSNENVFFERFERFLIMNAYDLALEDPRKAYEFLSKEVMKTKRKSVREKQESIKRMIIEIVTLLVENKYLKAAKNLLVNLTSLDVQVENEIFNKDEVKVLGSSGILNENEKENDFDAWLKSKENRVLINFAYSFCVDGERKKAKSFLRKHICPRNEGEIERKEIILKNAMNYLNNLIKREIGTIKNL